MRINSILLLIATLIITAQLAIAAEESPVPTKFEVSQQPGGAHAWLASLEGEWAGTARTWFDPDQLADISPVSGTMRLILGGRFILHEYNGTLTGEAMEGVAIHGYNLGEQQFETAWVNNLHNGTSIMFSEGERGAWPGADSVLGSYADYSTEGAPRWGWRTTIELPEPDHLILRHYNITPEGKEDIGVEFDYRRVNSE